MYAGGNAAYAGFHFIHVERQPVSAHFLELAFERFYPQRPAAPAPWRLGEPVPGPTTDLFSRKARELGVVVVINLYERAGDRGFDCSPVIDADGSLLGRTRMIHITDYPCFHEQGYYTPGDTGAPVYRTKAGVIGVAIWYALAIIYFAARLTWKAYLTNEYEMMSAWQPLIWPFYLSILVGSGSLWLQAFSSMIRHLMVVRAPASVLPPGQSPTH